MFPGCRVKESEPVSWYSREADQSVPVPVYLVPSSTFDNLDLPPFQLLPPAAVCNILRHRPGSPWQPLARGSRAAGLHGVLGGARGRPLSEAPLLTGEDERRAAPGPDESLHGLCCYLDSKQRPCVLLWYCFFPFHDSEHASHSAM